MKADSTLLSEIKRAAGKTRSERLAFLGQCNAFSSELGKAIKDNNGRQQLKTIFDRVMLGYPRTVTDCCLAATIVMREGMTYASQVWAQGVLEAWNPTSSQRLRAYIDDNLHFSRIETYAGSFISATTIN